MVQGAAAPLTLSREPLFQRGVDLYRQGAFFECHEVLEDLWRPMRGPHRLFLQALIHFAVAFYHLERRNPVGARRQLRKGLRKLADYLPAYEGLDTAALFREGEKCLERILAGEAPGAPPLAASSAGVCAQE
jgi:predicted metal-dependent hydrolase